MFLKYVQSINNFLADVKKIKKAARYVSKMIKILFKV